jgi:Na+(H+)/acetate symporter ActP
VFAVPAGFVVMVLVSLMSAGPEPAQRDLVERLRVPGPGER